MVATQRKPELIAIVGPTASGKSALAMKIAGEFDGEIIAADSRTIYKGMDIGTAKASKGDQRKIKHWGLDLVEPGQRFTAHEFQKYAIWAISTIKKRGKLPILAGGTGLYIDSVLFGFEFSRDADMKQRERLEALSIEELQGIILKKGYKMPLNSKNRRHLIRTIESEGKIGTKAPKPLKNSLIIGLMPPDNVLKDRINKRAEAIMASDILNETRSLISYGDDAFKGSAGIVYKICLRLIKGEISELEALYLFKKADWQYARRQRTWFKRNKFIRWYPDTASAYRVVAQLLNN